MMHATTKKMSFRAVFALGALFGLASCGGLNVEHAMSKLYEDVPSAREKVDNSVGYVVFDIVSLHWVAFSFASGKGMTFDKDTTEWSPMRLFRLGLGPGLAVKRGYLYLIFEDPKTFADFVDGRWGGGVLAESSFRFGNFGGSLVAEGNFANNVVAYYRTHTGVALELVLAGARFWPTRSEEQ